jgi:type I restriction enzyme S subunit
MNHILVFKESRHLSSKYLLYRLLSKDFVKYASQNVSGVQHPRVSFTVLSKFETLLPPLAEQHRIAEMIEELFTKLDAGVEELQQAKARIKQYRQSVLTHAFTGKLTAQWREKHIDQLEPALALLTIIDERRGKTRGARYKPISSDSESAHYDIPQLWSWVSLQNVFDVITDGDHQPPPQTDTGIPLLVIGNIRSGKLDFSDTRYVSESYYNEILESRKPRKGDILYSVVGSFGIPAFVDTDDEFCVQRHLAILKPSVEVNTKYLLFVLKSSFVFNQADKCSTGTAQKTVPLTGLRAIKIPLPPRMEQDILAAEIERHFSIADKAEEVIDKSLRQAETLRQSILKKAFEGRLVPQDPYDEPASDLLERIKEEKEKLKATKKKASPKKRKANK